MTNAIEGMLTVRFDEDEVDTSFPASLNESTGEIFPTNREYMSKIGNGFDILEKIEFIDVDGKVYEVCTSCGNHIIINTKCPLCEHD